MGFLELIIGLAGLMLALSIGMLLLKFVFAVVLIPIKIAFFLAKGLLFLVVLLPLLLIFGSVVAALLPIGVALLFLPVVLLGGIVCALAGI